MELFGLIPAVIRASAGGDAPYTMDMASAGAFCWFASASGIFNVVGDDAPLPVSMPGVVSGSRMRVLLAGAESSIPVMLSGASIQAIVGVAE